MIAGSGTPYRAGKQSGKQWGDPLPQAPGPMRLACARLFERILHTPPFQNSPLQTLRFFRLTRLVFDVRDRSRESAPKASDRLAPQGVPRRSGMSAVSSCVEQFHSRRIIATPRPLPDAYVYYLDVEQFHSRRIIATPPRDTPSSPAASSGARRCRRERKAWSTPSLLWDYPG